MARKKALDENVLTDSTYYILIALVEPLHGYGIMKHVSEISQGEVEIGAASLYTILKKLMQADLILLKDENNDRKKIYEITGKGKKILREDIKRRERMVSAGHNILNLIEEE